MNGILKIRIKTAWGICPAKAFPIPGTTKYRVIAEGELEEGGGRVLPNFWNPSIYIGKAVERAYRENLPLGTFEI